MKILQIKKYEKYKNIDFSKLSYEELYDLFKYGKNESLNFSELIRALIVREAYLNLLNKKETRSFRNLWYEFKPILMRADKQKSEESKWGRRASQKLSAILSDMVLNNLITYEDLSIEDETRTIYFRDENYYKSFSDLIIIVEKDSIIRRIKGIAEYYNATLISVHGFGATSAIEKIINNLDKNTEYTIVAITDYDAFGFSILEDFEKRAKILGLNCKTFRAGINPDYFSKSELDFLKYPVPKNNKSDLEWIKKYGIDGAFGLELDAITDPTEFRQWLINWIKNNFNRESEFFQEIREKTKSDAIEPSILTASEKIIEGDIRTLIRNSAFRLYQLAEEIYNTVLNDIKEESSKIINNLAKDSSFDTRPNPLPDSLHNFANQNSEPIIKFFSPLLSVESIKDLFINKTIEIFPKNYEKIQLDKNLEAKFTQIFEKLNQIAMELIQILYDEDEEII